MGMPVLTVRIHHAGREQLFATVDAARFKVRRLENQRRMLEAQSQEIFRRAAALFVEQRVIETEIERVEKEASR